VRIGWLCLATAAVAAAVWLPRTVHAQIRASSIRATDAASIRQWDSMIDRMLRTGELRVRRTDDDTLVAGRAHERLSQLYKGVPIYGGELTRQTDNGLTVSLFGTVYENVQLDVTPKLTSADAAAVIKRESGVELGGTKMPALWILPEENGFRLVYRASAFTARGGTEYFIDAISGAIVKTLDAARRQSAVGTGTGVLGDTKKMSVTSSSGAFFADDALRPPRLVTFDMHSNLQRTLDFLNGLISLLPSDRASDSDNTWTDTATVDAHTYAGYVYDYYFKRFGRRGLDNNNFRILGLVHMVSRQNVFTATEDQLDFYLNAAYVGDGVMIYGEGLPPNVTFAQLHFNYFSGALDIVGHELTHGVTDFTSQLIYENESGALNESFSDMMGTAIEFYYQPAGSGALRADYLIGEDVITPGGIRSMANPAPYGQPDHYSKRVTTTDDNGGVHTNSGIGNQAYYLAIEGGTNRTSGVSVQGVGQANREQIEKVMYRAFTQLMPANANYSVARSVTIQSARDLYGAGSAAERAITQAWTAVGVN
jgi:Zn-dependent metalloprotease